MILDLMEKSEIIYEIFYKTFYCTTMYYDEILDFRALLQIHMQLDTGHLYDVFIGKYYVCFDL